MELTIVKWVDAVSEDSWEEIDEAKKLDLHEIFTVGFLLDQDDSKIIIASSWDKDREAVAQHIAIPLAWIIEMDTIKVGRKWQKLLSLSKISQETE